MGLITVEKKATLTGHRDSIFALSPSQYSNIFFSAGADGLVASWDLKDPENGQLVAQVPNSVYAMIMDPESNHLVVGHNYDGIHIIDWEQKKEVASLNFTKEAIYDLKKVDNFIYAGTGGGELIIIDLDKLTIVDRIRNGEDNLRRLAYNDKTRELAAGYSDNNIRVFNTEDFKLIKEWKAHEKSVFGLHYSPDYGQLLSTGRDARFKVWNVQSQYELIEPVIGHMYSINDINFSPDGKHFVTCSMDKTIKVWDAAGFKLLKVIDHSRHGGHTNSVNKVLWSKYEDLVISCSDDRTISIWNLSFNNQ